jgi:paraquat-inducible protein A
MKNKISLVSLFFSIFFFILGLWYPILSTKQKVLGFVLDYKEVRLFDSVKMFYESNEYFLAIIILVFTILLPIIKFLELLNREFKIIIFTKTISKILHALDKWSMLDVFLVAILLVNFKMDSSIIIMKVKIGTTFIALSVILRMLSSTMKKLNKI